MVVRVGIVDLISLRADSMTRRVFTEAVAAGAALISDRSDFRLETTVFGIDPLGPLDDVDWPGLRAMDALIVSGSEPTTADIADEPSLGLIAGMLRECSAATSLLFSCQSAHAALHFLYGLRRQRLGVRCHGTFLHEISGAGELVAGLPAEVFVPHSRWNVMTSADLRDASVPILLDSTESEWHLAASADGLQHVFLQGHPEYLCDTMAREYRRDLRRWLADQTRPFPEIPLAYFPFETHQYLMHHAMLVRSQGDPALLDDFPLPASYAEVTSDWSGHTGIFFANWLRAIHDRREAKALLAA
ncbi:homoserine O-acetyltransferase/O-succinyltransferase family protein [Nocardia huaxiensis]|uniref:homoserine O-acetyltransferase/O-succinyltransferase family protein n=1 Tax=Nocardia huaxiensis TaxID=2755382 RepID=UPI001E54E919|nr:homoserine O-succinyltransferase [Nocardia huaxiensis]UFS99573.1 homoserine O-succinyltransferase [Nocardia huaxiensis]